MRACADLFRELSDPPNVFCQCLKPAHKQRNLYIHLHFFMVTQKIQSTMNGGGQGRGGLGGGGSHMSQYFTMYTNEILGREN